VLGGEYMAKIADKKKVSSKKDEEILDVKPIETPKKPMEAVINASAGVTQNQEVENGVTVQPEVNSEPVGTVNNLNGSDSSQNQVETPSFAVSEKTDEETAPAMVDGHLNGMDSTETEKQPSKFAANSKSIIMAVGLVFALGGLIAGGIFYSRSSLDNRAKADQTKKEAEAQTEVVVSPTSSPTPEEVKLSEYKISVLNGSGVAGRAGEVSALIEAVGFENIDTGNADAYDYVKTQVELKKDLPDKVFEEVKKALGETYELENKELDENSEFDVVIVVGEKI